MFQVMRLNFSLVSITGILDIYVTIFVSFVWHIQCEPKILQRINPNTNNNCQKRGLFFLKFNTINKIMMSTYVLVQSA